ncbi:UDP-glucose dehydrogenase family protein [Pseudomonas sp. Marseille-P9899]|uniref:UDP-glucose dehydrogenase family protein n=1 Tax=Pseudomonas sp. Marseille-P9899 TaxID=2730401 RepID=UPI00158A29CA|nr:UDP-glucose/GDP-mannose dehydrogenase family protein [Pseudomonas sp. Marseille-P9899]
MKLAVFGTGYVGLTLAACLAEVGHWVCCVDVDAERVDALSRGHCPIFEPGLPALLHKGLASSRLLFSTDAVPAIEAASVIFIAVGTPPLADGSADLRQVFAVADAIARHAHGAKVIVNKSTSPVGTVDAIKARLISLRPDSAAQLDVVSNPEFLKEGSAVIDCMRPDRVIIGGASTATLALLKELFSPFSRNHDTFISMDARSAELSKYAANCMLATKISFMNEMANLAEHLGADIEAVRRGIGSDPRIGYDFIYAGCGFGGSCFPKDLTALQRIAERHDYQPRLLQAVDAINQRQKHRLFEKILQHYNADLSDKTFAVWGLAFKPNTDDMREASSQVLLQALWQAGAKVRAFDPQARHEARRRYGERNDLELLDNKEDALTGANALVIVTEWEDFKVLDSELVRQRLLDQVIFDGRNLFEPAHMADAGLAYYSIGREEVRPGNPRARDNEASYSLTSMNSRAQTM